jgi:hypothetical protein
VRAVRDRAGVVSVRLLNLRREPIVGRRLREHVASVPPKRRGTSHAVVVAVHLHLCDRCPDGRGYVNDTVQQVADAIGLGASTVARALAVLDDPDWWPVPPGGRGRGGSAGVQGEGSRRAPAWVVWADPHRDGRVEGDPDPDRDGRVEGRGDGDPTLIAKPTDPHRETVDPHRDIPGPSSRLSRASTTTTDVTTTSTSSLSASATDDDRQRAHEHLLAVIDYREQVGQTIHTPRGYLTTVEPQVAGFIAERRAAGWSDDDIDAEVEQQWPTRSAWEAIVLDGAYPPPRRAPTYNGATPPKPETTCTTGCDHVYDSIERWWVLVPCTEHADQERTRRDDIRTLADDIRTLADDLKLDDLDP